MAAEERWQGESAKMPVVYKVMLRCPQTGEPVDSGIRTTGRETVTGGLVRDGIVRCSHCGTMHSLGSDCYLDVERITSTDALWRPNR